MASSIETDSELLVESADAVIDALRQLPEETKPRYWDAELRSVDWLGLGNEEAQFTQALELGTIPGAELKLEWGPDDEMFLPDYHGGIKVSRFEDPAHNILVQEAIRKGYLPQKVTFQTTRGFDTKPFDRFLENDLDRWLSNSPYHIESMDLALDTYSVTGGYGEGVYARSSFILRHRNGRGGYRVDITDLDSFDREKTLSNELRVWFDNLQSKLGT